MISDFPIYTLKKRLQDIFATQPRSVLRSPPGTGKSTVLPLIFEEVLPPGERIILLQPRRAAARAVCRRIRDLAGNPGIAGCITRTDRDVPKDHRILVMTEGVFVRSIIDDPELERTAMVILDEFHERSLNTDLSYVLLDQVVEILFPRIRMMIMSATVDSKRFVEAGFCEVLYDYQPHPVTVRYLPPPPGSSEMAMLREAIGLHDTEGSILVFLPGEGEIRRAERDLLAWGYATNYDIFPLYSRLSPEKQELALEPGTRQRIILATNIAETSLTIPGIVLVIDSGLRRNRVLDADSGTGRLVTRRISQASAIQRTGRAGRLGPGTCIRLWREEEQLMPYDEAMIRSSELCDLLMALASWGDSNTGNYGWPDIPPANLLKSALNTLIACGIMDRSGSLLPRGETVWRMGTGYRVGLLLEAATPENQSLAAAVAAVLENPESDPLNSGINLEERVAALMEHRLPNGPASSWLEREYQRIGKRSATGSTPAAAAPTREKSRNEAITRFLYRAYPDRLGKLERGLYRMAQGSSFALPDGLGWQPEWIIAPEAGRMGDEVRVRLAVEVSQELIKEIIEESSTESDHIVWKDGFQCRRERRLGSILLSVTPISPEMCRNFEDQIIDVLKKQGTAILPQKRTDAQLIHRISMAKSFQNPQVQLEGEQSTSFTTFDGEIRLRAAELLKSFSKRIQAKTAHTWFSTGKLPISYTEAVEFCAGWQIMGELNRTVPNSYSLPSGTKVEIDYSAGTARVAARIQQLFGLSNHPRICGRPVEFELLSPANRPVQRTSDILSFWNNTYPEVRKELRGRYIKHFWPEDPLNSPPTNGTARSVSV